jgi:lipopolysaccharide transport system ATP-binding protein
MSRDILLSAEDVSKKFCRSLKRSLWYGVQDIAAEVSPFTRRHPKSGSYSGLRPDEFWAVEHVSFELRRGECLGLVGRNGAGKTTLLKMLNGLIRPDGGRISIRGRLGALIALGAGFNPILTGRENIYVNASVLGLSRSEIDGKVDEIIDFAEIGDFIDTPVQNYSSGMQVRLGFAVATALEPDVLLLDEVLAVGDTAFRAKCFQRIGTILDRAAVIFVSHDAVQVSRICDRCLYLKGGEMVAIGPTDEIQERYYRDQPEADSGMSVVLDPGVSKFSCQSSQSCVGWGESIDIVMTLDLHTPQRIGLALVALLNGEASVAQADVTDQLNADFSAGPSAKLRLGPLNLRAGTYHVVVTLLNESRKGTLVHAVNCLSFDVAGPKGFGVPYQMPVSPIAS